MVARVCAAPGCPEFTPCPTHKPRPWARTSKRNTQRPNDWTERKQRVRERDGGVCYWCGLIGAGPVDHVIPVADGGSWDLDNLAQIHADCHDAKTYAEQLARQAAR